MNVCIYIPRISCLMVVNDSIERDQTSACEGASGCRYQSIFDLTRPPNPGLSKFEVKIASHSSRVCETRNLHQHHSSMKLLLVQHGFVVFVVS